MWGKGGRQGQEYKDDKKDSRALSVLMIALMAYKEVQDDPVRAENPASKSWRRID